MRKLTLLVPPVLFSLAAGCAAGQAAWPEHPVAPDAAYLSALQARRAQRLAELTSEEGWLALHGLFWLEGTAAGAPIPVGAAEDCPVRLPARAPARVGELLVQDGAARLRLAPGLAATLNGAAAGGELALRADADEGGPDRLRLDGLCLIVIRRGTRLAARVWDAQAEARRLFAGIEHFPVDLRYRVEGRLEPYPSPRRLRMPTARGPEQEAEAPGVVRFELGGQALSLVPLTAPGSRELFFVFGDETNGRESYGGGRFLDATLAPDGRVLLDFNRAESPPCAFTPYATCPIPRPENRLPVRIEAGELRAHGRP
ncbi:MAG TPA: DUF1684 domain-containing protein [Myxococcota bacterium]|nr:DUF1684 domain-containing protein [Myxococcota bacterium]HRY92490.1 DUF1684 domain-containing protein [Myxococcota bacterium]HSA22628.1 DUF1684 domain-containing protein [Myxococcota bacterium]